MTEAVRPADREREAAREHYNRVAMLYDLVEVLDERTFRPWRQRLLAQAGGRVLEVGVGTGKNFPWYPPGVALTGIDIAEKMLAAARQRARRLGLAVELHLADVQALEFREGVFDTAVSTFVFCSVPDPVRGTPGIGASRQGGRENPAPGARCKGTRGTGSPHGDAGFRDHPTHGPDDHQSPDAGACAPGRSAHRQPRTSRQGPRCQDDRGRAGARASLGGGRRSMPAAFVHLPEAMSN